LPFTSLADFISIFFYFRFIDFQTVYPLRFRRLHITEQRLGAAAASTNVHAGYKVSNTHGIFRGVTAAVAPNRKL
jgi:hypothetical protein